MKSSRRSIFTAAQAQLARRSFIGKLLLITGASLLPSFAWASTKRNQLTAMSPSFSEHQTRLSFHLTAVPKYHIFTLQHPSRLVIDFDNTDLKTKVDTIKQQCNFSQVRWSVSSQKLRLVFDLPDNRKISFHSHVENDMMLVDINQNLSNHVVKAHIPEKRNIRIVIDPGHGGKDPGASGKLGTHEKDVVLAIARKLRSKINKTKGYTAVLTRDQDKFISLKKRIELAHQHNADIFVSVHADACDDRSVSGSSVYILSRRGASSVMAKRLANRENSADLIGGLSLKDKDQTLAKVLLDLSQTNTLQESTELANHLIGNLAKHEKALHKNVERAAFAVLKSPDIPSVLVETAFISNPREEKRLRTAAFQNKVAASLHQGLINYCDDNRAAMNLVVS